MSFFFVSLKGDEESMRFHTPEKKVDADSEEKKAVKAAETNVDDTKVGVETTATKITQLQEELVKRL